MAASILGSFIRAARLTQVPPLSLAKLARLAGVSRRQLAALERGANVSWKFVDKIAAVLNLSSVPLRSNPPLVASAAGSDLVAEVLVVVNILEDAATRLRDVALHAIAPFDPVVTADSDAISRFVDSHNVLSASEPRALERALRRLEHSAVTQSPEPVQAKPQPKRARSAVKR